MHVKRLSLNRHTIFYTSLTLYLMDELLLKRSNIDELLGVSLCNTLSDIATLTIVVLFVLRALLFEKWNREQIIRVGIVLAITLTASLVSRTSATLTYIIIIYLAKDISFERIVKVDLLLISTFVFLIIALNLFGLISGTVLLRLSTDTQRNSMGFSHPNTLGAASFLWIANFLYLKRNQKGFYKYILSTTICIVIYLITNSYTPLIVSLIFIIALVARDIIEKKHVASRTFLRVLFGSIAFATLLLIIYLWNNPNVLTGGLSTFRSRFLGSQKYLKVYGVKLFGNKIAIGLSVYLPGLGMRYGYLDNGYIRILVELGILFFTVFFYYYLSYLINAIKERDSFLLIYAFVFLIYGITEKTAFSLSFNIFLILFIDYYRERPPKHSRIK